ncbi:hypothetical protein BDY21DRAFT_369432 [Lineolata rhizophorae]|uniref:Uncharacterized protein n=1 Tax=Lineolata rhizophorae TaxID=578093 RepID=A0A6A6P916_9PEZI|nr:hypothetical protein BDY21DRAFT_369432 [Lineolata rhizophorae]
MRMLFFSLLFTLWLTSALADDVYQFSGAVYVVNGNGGTWQAGTAAVCPADATVNCADVGYSDWCCPGSCYCAVAANNVVGCCQNGQNCVGNVAVQEIRTTTVYVQQTSYIQVQGPPTTVVVQATPDNPVVVAATPNTQNVVYNGYCSTLTADGPGLPTTAAGDCGTILVVNEGSLAEIFSVLRIFLVLGHVVLWLFVALRNWEV